MFLKKLVKDYVGLDISETAVKEAKKQGLNAIIHDLQKPLPFDKNSFDLVICMDTLEHLFDPEFTMKEIFRVIKPKGTVIISIPNVAWIPQRIQMLIGIFHPGGSQVGTPSWLDPHIRFWNLKSYKKFIVVARFRLIELRSIFYMENQTQTWILDWFFEFVGDIFPSLFAPYFISALKPLKTVAYESNVCFC